MNIIVLHPSGCKKSAQNLSDYLKDNGYVCRFSNPFETGKRDYRDYDLVINYGCGLEIIARHIINTGIAVKRCVNKIATFTRLDHAGIPHLNWTTNKNVAKDWDVVVVRKNAKGRQNDGMEYVYKGEHIPDGQLYTEYYEHKEEYRIVVFKGAIIARCIKKLNAKGEWTLEDVNKRSFKKMDEACINAAKTLGIDYVGFDVLAKNRNNFVICEANSGPTIVWQAYGAFLKYGAFLNFIENI